MENLAKTARNFLIACGLLFFIVAGYGYYKYSSLVSRYNYLDNYIEKYIEREDLDDALMQEVIKQYEKKVDILEATIEELKKEKGRWWGNHNVV